MLGLSQGIFHFIHHDMILYITILGMSKGMFHFHGSPQDAF